MARPLVPLAVALVVGIALGGLADRFPLGACALALGLWAGQRLTRRSLPRVLAFGRLQWLIVLAGAVYAAATPPPTPDVRLTQETVRVRAVLDSPIRSMPQWVSVTAADLRLDLPDGDVPLPGRIRVAGSPEAFAGLRYGDVVRITADFRPPRGFRNPGLFDYGEWLARQHIVGVATLKPGEIEREGHERSPILDPVYAWRERIRLAALASLPERLAPVFLAMVTGETGYLTSELRDRFMASGTVHLLSISGSHLGLIAVVIFFLVRRLVCRLPERLLLRLTLMATPSQIAAVATIIPVTGYALLAGGQVATLRALLMIALYLLAVLIHREDDLLNALALAALMILVWDPHALADLSFQLSFLSVLCIALGVDWWRAGTPRAAAESPPTRRQRLSSRLSLVLVTSIAATVGTAPLVAHHFHQVNWVGLVSNAVIIPLAGAVVVPLGLASGVWAAIENTTELPLAQVNAAALDLLVTAVEMFARWPASIVHVAAPPLLIIALGYLVLAFLLDRRMAPWKRGVAGGVLLVLIMPWGVGMPRWGSVPTLDVTFLDVGQGDGAIIRFPSGHVMVVDGGKRFHELDLGRMVVAPMLWNSGTQGIDYLVATHPQLDHIGGLVYLAEHFTVGEAWVNGRQPALWAADRLNGALAAGRIPASIAPGDQPGWIGASRVWRLNPLASAPFAPLPKGLNENDRSIVLRVEYGRASVLLTGDLEAPGARLLAERAELRELLRSTVIKVPHHGSRGALSPAFLRAVSPRVAIVSAGANNSYGHPTPEMLRAYARLKSAIFRTDLNGAVKIVTDGTHLHVYRYADLTPQRVTWNAGMVRREWNNLRTSLGLPIPALSIDLSQTELPF